MLTPENFEQMFRVHQEYLQSQQRLMARSASRPPQRSYLSCPFCNSASCPGGQVCYDALKAQLNTPESIK